VALDMDAASAPATRAQAMHTARISGDLDNGINRFHALPSLVGPYLGLMIM
jgi:hypothetical protein